MDNQSVDESQTTEQASIQASTVAGLEELKSQAIGVLLPLIDSLEEPAERKFEILMMASRSSQDPALLSKTLEMAQQLEGKEKIADAVLDVLNEIDLKIRNQTSA